MITPPDPVSLNGEAETPIEIPPSETHPRTNRMSQLVHSRIEVKNAGKELYVVGVDLSGSPNDIQQQITALADHLEETVQAAPQPT